MVPLLTYKLSATYTINNDTTMTPNKNKKLMIANRLDTGQNMGAL